MSDFPKIQDAWIWPDSVERWFRERTDGRTLHVCCGKSSVGDIRVDADPLHDPDLVADAKNLPFDEATFDCVVIDPPWNVNVYRRPDWFWPSVRVTKPDGVVLTNTTWIPWSNQTVVEEVVIRQDYRMGSISVLAKHRRYPGQTTLDSDR